MLKFEKNSWHRRIITWGLGRSYLQYHDWDKDNEKMIWVEKDNINLCPYMRALIGVFLVSPWIALYKLLPKYCTVDHPDATRLFLLIGSICSIIHILGTGFLEYEWWYVPAGVIVMTTIVSAITGLIFGSMALNDWIHSKRSERKWSKGDKPSIVREYIKAKHNKVCPQIEFVD